MKGILFHILFFLFVTLSFCAKSVHAQSPPKQSDFPRLQQAKEQHEKRREERMAKMRQHIKLKINSRLEKKLSALKNLSIPQKIRICKMVLGRVEKSLQNEKLTPENTLLFMIFREVLQEKLKILESMNNAKNIQ